MKERGVTLPELLVTIVIIAALLGILFPALLGARKKAQLSQCIHNVHQIGVAVLSAAADNNNQVVAWYNPDTNKYWWATLESYLGISDSDQNAGSDRNAFWSSPLRCPADTYFDSRHVDQTVSYGWNYIVLGSDNDQGLPDNGHGRPLSKFSKPSDTLVITDSATTDSWGFIDNGGHSPDPVRHNGKTSALFLDGHVTAIDASTVVNTDPYLNRNTVTD